MDKFAWMKELRGAHNLTHAEFRVLVILSTYSGPDLDSIYPGVNTLTENAGVNVKTTKAALKSLEAKGWIQLVDPGGNQHFYKKANEYRLSVPDMKGPSEYPPSQECQGAQSVPPRGPVSSTRGPVGGEEGDHPLGPHQYIDQNLESGDESGDHSLGIIEHLGLGTFPDTPFQDIQVIAVEPEPAKPAPADPPPVDLFTQCRQALGRLTPDEEQKIKKLIEEKQSKYKILPIIRADRDQSRKRSA